jgi:hypothetical protein
MTVRRSRIGQGVHRAEAGGRRLRGEPGPATAGGGEVLVHDHPAAPVTIGAGAHLALQLEQLHDGRGLTGGGHDPELAIGPSQHETSCPRIEHLDAAVSKQRQQFHHVEVRHQGARQLY